jgi:DNA-binding HxlR family transcriptional regulator
VNESTSNDRVSRFVKALANETRLRIVGLLSLGARTCSELTEGLGLRPDALTRHIHLLREAGLIVDDETSGGGRLRLETAWLRSGNALSDSVKRLPDSITSSTLSSLEATALSPFVRDGRISKIPVAAEKQKMLMRWLVERFETGRSYPEREVNAILKEVHPDFAALRRMLIDYRNMERDHGVYRRL